MTVSTKQKIRKLRETLPERNGRLVDPWSPIHLLTGVLFGWLVNPFVGLALMVLWEPLENFVISPILGRYGITFGYETLRNSLSDIVFDTLGVGLGYYLLVYLVPPPFHLFG